jgi:DNA-directed RNA polymerase subunit RPC12/RpoP
MKTVIAPKEIEFECPNCHQRYKSATYQDGMECACQNCNFQFTILAIEPHAEIPALRISAPEPSTPPDSQTIPQKESEEQHVQMLFYDAANTNGSGTFLLVGAMLAFAVAIIAMLSQSVIVSAIAGSISGGALMIGLACKILAQLEYIRAEVRAHRKGLR